MIRSKRIIVFLILIVLSAFIIYNFFIIKKDFKYRHQVFGLHPAPVNWIAYDFYLTLDKIIKSFQLSEKPTLPRVDIFITSKNKKKLLVDIPNSTKKWKKAYLLRDDGSLQKVKARHRGDNPLNYAFNTKSWRIKLKKDQLIDGTRVFDYSVPQSPSIASDYFPLHLARKIGVLAPKSRLVELYINGNMSGVYIETQKLDELLLRNNKIMPVNLYKGEKNNSDAFLSIGDNLFNNPYLWSKQAIFNHYKEDNFSDIKMFLSLLSAAETSHADFNELLKRIDVDIWAKFAVLQILTQSMHNDSNHNMRIAIDQWAGKLYPIPHDIGSSIDIDDIFIDKSPNAIFSLLNKSSIFLDLKYKYLNAYLSQKILSEESKYIKKISKSIYNSLSKSSQLLQFKEIYDISHVSEKIKNLISDISILENKIMLRMQSRPNVVWNSNTTGKFKIIVDGEIPISRIKLKFKGENPKSITLDYGNDGLADNDDINIPFIINDKGEATIDLTLYANRITSAEGFSAVNEKNRSGSLSTALTEFNFIMGCNCKVSKIYGKNNFSEKIYNLQHSDLVGVLPSIHNRAILPAKLKLLTAEIITLSGINIIDKTIIFDTKVKILEGTVFKLGPGVSVVFRGGVEANGTDKNPIIFERSDKNTPWGSVALQDGSSNNSVLANIRFSGGSGGSVNGIRYTSMLSLHNVENVELNYIDLINNSIYDDTIHLVYCKSISIDSMKINGSFLDAMDIDMSNDISIVNSKIRSSGNDALDLMGSSVLIYNSTFEGAADKGISLGENSNALIYRSFMLNNNTGIAVKDASTVVLLDNIIKDNIIDVGAYSKNWRYGSGGNVVFLKSMVENNNISISNDSKIAFDSPSLYNYKGDKNKFKKVIFYNPEVLMNDVTNGLLLKAINRP